VYTGVLLIAKEIIWRKGKAYVGRSLPINFDSCINATIDEEHLKKILIFNANGSGKTPSPSKKVLKEREDAKLLKLKNENENENESENENENKDNKKLKFKKIEKIVLIKSEGLEGGGSDEVKVAIKKEKTMKKEKVVKGSKNTVVDEADDKIDDENLLKITTEVEGKKVPAKKAKKSSKADLIESVILEYVDIKNGEPEESIIDIKNERVEESVIDVKKSTKKTVKRKAEKLLNNDITENDVKIEMIEEPVIVVKKSKMKIEKKNNEETDDIPVVKRSTRKRNGDGAIKSI
jgi:hypothetical protein